MQGAQLGSTQASPSLSPAAQEEAGRRHLHAATAASCIVGQERVMNGSGPPSMSVSATGQTAPARSCEEWLCREPGLAGDRSSNVQIPPSLPNSLPEREARGGELGRKQEPTCC